MWVVRQYLKVGLLIMLSLISFSSAYADELVKQIQQDLNTLGYDAGTADGKMGVKTQMAIGKFQKTYGLAVDGKPSVSVAIAISEAKDASSSRAAVRTQAADTSNQVSAEQLATQEACLKRKAEEAQAAQKSSMFGALTDMAGTMLSSFGQHELAMMLGQAKTVAQQAETVSQLSKDLGITEQQVQDCLSTGH